MLRKIVTSFVGTDSFILENCFIFGSWIVLVRQRRDIFGGGLGHVVDLCVKTSIHT